MKTDDVFLLTFEDVAGIAPNNQILDLGSARVPVTRSSTITARRYADRTTGLPRNGRFLVYFGNATDYIEFPYRADSAVKAGSGNALTTGDFFIGGWVYYPSAPNVGGAYYPISVQDSTPTAAGTAWALAISGQRLLFVWSDGTTRRFYDRTTTAAYINAAGWYYIAAERYQGRVFLSVNGTVKEYFNCNHTLNVPSAETIRFNSAKFAPADEIGLTFHDLWQIKRRAPFRGGNFQAPRLEPVGTGPIVWRGPKDPYFTQVTLHLPMTGANGSSTFTDLSNTPATITPTGSPTISTATDPYGDGLGALSLNGTSQGLLTNRAPAVGTGVFTLSCWVRRTGTPTGAGRIINAQSGVSPYISTYLTTGNLLAFQIRDLGGVGSTVITGTTVLAINTWYHFVAQRGAAGAMTIFVNGVSEATGTGTHNATGAPNYEIGYLSSGGSQFFPGQIRDVQIIEGLARYPGNFQPPVNAELTS